MKLTKFTALGALVASTLFLYGCGGSDGDNVTIEIDASTTGEVSGSSVSETCPSFSTPKQKQAGVDVCALPTTILEDTNLTSDIIWLMEGRVTVGDGNGSLDAAGTLSGTAVTNVDLTIAAGTQIQGATGTFANLVITRGSRLLARGTAAEPIIFSSDDDDLTGSGEWGGLIVHGYSYHNECFTGAVADATCNVDSEGESGFAGGFDEDDDSGIIQYVVITEGGFEFAPGDEINGLSLMSVGSGTTIDHIQINANADDGVEFYGGTVNTSHFVMTGNLDDSVDWDEGFQGTLQYYIVEQIPDSFGNAIEADTEGSTEFDSVPFLINTTFIGDGTDGEMFRFKSSSGGIVVNSVVTGPANAAYANNCVLVAGGGAIANQGGSLELDNVLWNCTGGFAETDTAAAATLGINLTEATADLTALYASGNAAAELLVDKDISGYADAGAYPAALFDSLSADISFIDTDGLGFLGAVDPAAATAWWDGWIIDGTL